MIIKNNTTIDTLEKWKSLAGPKRADQWKDGRSAKETALAWLEAGPDNLPQEIEDLLARHDDFGPVSTWSAEPEAKLRFDSFAGEPRNSDMVVTCTDAKGEFSIAVESKADEAFGETIADTMAAALERKIENPRSNGIARVEQLVAALLGPRKQKEPALRDIRYQLLTACAGALKLAIDSKQDRVLVLVHEFATSKTSPEKRKKNTHDLDLFLKRLSHLSVTALKECEICGPFHVPGLPLFDNPPRLYVGKVVRHFSMD
jgi:hypothetical protein